MIFPVYFSHSGAPAAGLTPTWSSLHDTSGTNRLAQAPAISEIGGGWYRFEIDKGTIPWDSADLVGTVDGGPALSGTERYVPLILSEQTFHRQADLVLGAAVASHKDQPGSLAADVNLIRQALAGKRTQEIATGRIRIYDADNAALLKTLQPDEQDGVLIVQEE